MAIATVIDTMANYSHHARTIATSTRIGAQLRSPGGARASWRVATVVLAQHTPNPVDHLGPVTVFRVSNSFAARCRLVDCAGIWRVLEYRGAAAWAPPWSLPIICLTRNGNTPSWRAMSVSVSSRRQCPSTPSVWSASSRCPNCSLSW